MRRHHLAVHGIRKTILMAVFCSIALAAPAPAQTSTATCVVADPTGTPLNIRMEPNGEVVAKVRNGETHLVFLGLEKTDSRGREWLYVAMSTSAAPDGYVLAAYVRCPD